MAKLNQMLSLVLGVALVLVLLAYMARLVAGSPPEWKGKSATLHCLADSQCPVGQKCKDSVCVEGFTAPVLASSTLDMSSCSTKECKDGINAPCSRRANPCPEGTFCHADKCINIAAPDQGEAYKQIGMLDV